jgi:serine/threonine protein kinase
MDGAIPTAEVRAAGTRFPVGPQTNEDAVSGAGLDELRGMSDSIPHATMSSAPVAVGDTIAGKYLVERIIGEGGMGVVIAARHLELDQIVAVKFLLPEIAKLDMAPERFRREAWAVARIRGEHVCRVLDVGTCENGIPFMVMEYLDGCDLATELASRGPIPVEEAVDYVLQACEALAEAHSAGIVHRDLKPANLFLAQRADGTRSVKVLDFGVSKVLSEAGNAALSLTSTKTLVGSPLYMSPEQLDSAKGVDARTDIWSLGVVLYELLTGRTPFGGDSIAQLVSGVLHANPPAFADVGIEPLSDLEAVILRAVSKKREDRYSSVAELATELIPFGPENATESAQRSTRLLARDPSTSLPVSLPSGQRVSTPRNAMGAARTPSGKVAVVTPAERSADRPQRTPNPGARVSNNGNVRDSTPVSWEHERSVSRRKRVGVVAVLLIGVAVAAVIVMQRTAAPGVPPAAASAPVDAPPANGEPGAALKAALPGPAGVAGAGAQTGAAALLAAKGTAGQRGGIVDAGGVPEPPPVEPPPPDPARPKVAAEARERPHRGIGRHKGVEPVAPASSAAEGTGVTDFGGRR